MPRPKITEITVKVELPGGKIQTIPVNPDTMAIFFDEIAVTEMLGVFYQNHPGHRLTRSDSIKFFGQKVTDLIFGPPPTVPPAPPVDDIELTPTVIDQIWNAEDDQGLNVSILSKIPPCIIC